MSQPRAIPIRRRLRALRRPPKPVAALALAVCLSACGEYDWRTHHSQDGRYRAAFPELPGSHEHRGPGPLDDGVLRVEDTYVDGILLQVAWTDLPEPPADAEDANALLLNVASATMVELTGNVTPPPPESFGDVPGWPQPNAQLTLHFSRGDFHRTAVRRYLIDGRRLYMVTAVTPRDAVDHPMARRFLDSFEMARP